MTDQERDPQARPRIDVTQAREDAAAEVRREGVHVVEPESAPGRPLPRPVGREPRWLPSPSVWAPAAGRVELDLGDRRVPMRRADRPDRPGWWEAAEALQLGAGSDYAFVLDGVEPALPDPRSPWQPAGVHGPSRTVDHEAFPWSDAGWQAPPLETAIVYELHVGTFTPEGTFDSAIERLDDLVALGITHVELMPVAEFAGERGWGYDGVDLFAPHHAYGGPDGLKRLVDAAHGRGLAVLVDVVYNHLGPAGNYLPRFGPYLTDRYHVAWGEAMNFDGPGSDEVRRFVTDNAVSWLRDYHADGLRLDAVHAIVDTSAVHILEEIAGAVDVLEAETGRRLVVIAESDLNDPRIVRPCAEGGDGIDAQWSDDFHHALHTTLTGEAQGYYADFRGLPDLARALSEAYVYSGQYSRARDRRHGRAATGIPATRFLGYLQNHDQVGNHALGERSAALMSPDALAVAAAVVLTAPFVPLLFMGEEWAAASPFIYFTDHEPGLGEAVRLGRHQEFAAFGWPEELFADPQSLETFDRSKLDWSERTRSPHDRLLAWHRDLIRARRETPALTDGRFPEVRYDADAGWLVADRGAAVLACNVARTAAEIRMDRADLAIALASTDGVSGSIKEGSLVLRLPPLSAALLTTPARP